MQLSVSGQAIHIDEKDQLVAGSIEQNTITFLFSNDWTGYTKIAVFWPHRWARYADENTDLIEVPIVNNSCQIPAEALVKAGLLQIGVYGVDAGKRRPTVWTKEIRIDTGTLDGRAPEDPTPSKYEQILDALGEINQREEANRTEAWRNSNTGAIFTGSTISLTNRPEGVKAVEIVFMNAKGTGQTFSETAYLSDPKISAEYTFWYNGALYTCFREADVRFSEGQIAFSGCSQNGDSADDKIVPVCVRWITV